MRLRSRRVSRSIKSKLNDGWPRLWIGLLLAGPRFTERRERQPSEVAMQHVGMGFHVSHNHLNLLFGRASAR
jgi:hypothetical protein